MVKKRWIVPENCPLKKIVECLDGDLRKDFQCENCPISCPLNNGNSKLNLKVSSDEWIINYADKFVGFINSVRQSKPAETNPLAKLNVSKRIVARLILKGVYPQIKQQFKSYFDFEWNKEMYDVLTLIAINSRNSIEVT